MCTHGHVSPSGSGLEALTDELITEGEGAVMVEAAGCECEEVMRAVGQLLSHRLFSKFRKRSQFA